jgi:peroxiredoxin family protein
VPEYIQMMIDGGAKFYACKMTADMMDLKKEDYIDGLAGVVTVVEFLDMTADSQIIFI